MARVESSPKRWDGAKRKGDVLIACWLLLLLLLLFLLLARFKGRGV